MALSTGEELAEAQPGALFDDVEREVRQDRYRALARAVVELAWHDAHGRAAVPAEVAEDARTFFFTHDAEFWAGAATVDLRVLRQRLEADRSCSGPDVDAGRDAGPSSADA